jgi:hypothetical protein
MRMSRRLAILGKAPNLSFFDNGAVSGYSFSYGVSGTKISLESKAWVHRNDHGTVDENVSAPARSSTLNADLRRYKYVHFTVSGGSGSRSISVGSVSKSNPAAGTHTLDISGISDRSNLQIKLYTSAASASAAGYYPSTNVVTNSIQVAKIWASA